MTEITRSKIEKHTREKGGVYFSMAIRFKNTEFGYCKERGFEGSTTIGDADVKNTITLFADNKEALKIKVADFI
tara:strand:- start:115 stop:336 length:222 start_codon:yes stop_codon:yes gene_type:complete